MSYFKYKRVQCKINYSQSFYLLYVVGGHCLREKDALNMDNPRVILEKSVTTSSPLKE